MKLSLLGFALMVVGLAALLGAGLLVVGLETGPSAAAGPVGPDSAFANFSSINNPSGYWSYGFTPFLGGPFSLYAGIGFTNPLPPMPAWSRPAGGVLFLAANTTGSTYTNSFATVPAGFLVLHPDGSGAYSVLRWTAPSSESYRITGYFEGVGFIAPGTTTDVHVLLDGVPVSGALSNTLINGFGAQSAFDFTLPVSQGSTIDFAVGLGSNLFPFNEGGDSTGLVVEVVPAAGHLFADNFNRLNNFTVGNGWFEYEPGGSATIDGNALRLTSGSATGDGVKVFRPLPQQDRLQITGVFRIQSSFSRVWFLVRADGASSLRNGYGFNWRLNPFDNQLHICDNTGDAIDCVQGSPSTVNNLPFFVGQAVAFEMLVFENNAIEVRLWDAAGARPSAATLFAGPRSPLASGSNLAIVESTRDSTLGDVIIDDIAVSSFGPRCDTDADCDDGNQCTTSTCEPSGTCSQTDNANACDDGNACTTGDTCSGGICTEGPSLDCDDGNSCNGTESCDPASGCQPGQTPREICMGGADEDCDGFADCNDLDCALDTSCRISIELVDPVSELLAGSEIISPDTSENVGTLATKGISREGVAADGVARLVIRVTAPTDGTVSFSLVDPIDPNGAPLLNHEEDGVLSDLPRAVSDDFAVPTLLTPQGAHKAFALYTAPARFVRSAFPTDENSRERRVFVSSRLTLSTGQVIDLQPVPIRILRPLVFLVHGIWSDESAWDHFRPLILGPITSDNRFTVVRANYKAVNDKDFATAAATVYNQLKARLISFKDMEKIAAIQADLISHSMGAPVIRTMALRPDYLSDSLLPTFERGPVHTLITLDGVHLGTQMANLLLSDQCIARIFTNEYMKPTGNGAVGDLAEGSTAIQAINSHAMPFQVHTVASLANDTQKFVNAIGINWYIDRFCQGNSFSGFDDVLGRENDLLVAGSSQRGGRASSLSGVTEFAHVIHSDPFEPVENQVLRVEIVARRVIELLNSTNPGDFVQLP